MLLFVMLCLAHKIPDRLVGQAARVSNLLALGIPTEIVGLELGPRESSTVPGFGEITVLLPFDQRVAALLQHSTAVIEGTADS